MSKPLRTQAKQVVFELNGVPTRRIQTADWTSAFTTDQVFELGNSGIVEESVTLVETSVTANAFEWGNTDMEAQMFGIYEQRNVLDNSVAGVTVVNAPATIYTSSFGAGGNWTALATNDWVQLIRINSSATVNDAEYRRVAGKTYVAASLSNRLTFATAFTAAPAGGDFVTMLNNYTITEDTVDSDPVHILLPHRQVNTSTLIMHTVCLPRCSVDNLTYSFDTGGASEANFTLVGEEERFLLGTRREGHTAPGSWMSYTNATVVYRVPISSLAAVGSPYMLYAGSDIVEFGASTGTDNITHVSAEATIEARIGSGLAVDANTQLVHYFTNKTKKGFRGLTNIDNAIGKLTKGNIVIQLQQASGTIEQLQRCTAVGISVPLTRESIDELGTSRSIGKPLEANLRQEITLSFSRNDLREYAKMLGQQDDFDAGTVQEILMTDLKSVKNITIIVLFYSHQTTHDATTLLKTMTFNTCNFTGDSATTPISGAAGLDLTFSSPSIAFVGSGVPPVLTT